eukprot:2095028-Ditylum_brightwellii.AAC.1
MGAGKGSGTRGGEDSKTVVLATWLRSAEAKADMLYAGSGAGGGWDGLILGMGGVIKVASCWGLLLREETGWRLVRGSGAGGGWG